MNFKYYIQHTLQYHNTFTLLNPIPFLTDSTLNSTG